GSVAGGGGGGRGGGGGGGGRLGEGPGGGGGGGGGGPGDVRRWWGGRCRRCRRFVRMGRGRGRRCRCVLCRHGHGSGRWIEFRELLEEPGVGIAFRRSRLGLARLPPADGGTAYLQCRGDLFDRQTVGLAQTPALVRRRQRSAGRDQRVDRIEQLGHGHLLAATVDQGSYVSRTLGAPSAYMVCVIRGR